MTPGASSWRRSRFFWLLVLLSIATLAAGVISLAAQAGRTAAQARPAPDFTLPAADGSTVRLSDLRGKVILLNFWATWCPPCKAEMPDLNALHREYGQAKNFVVLGVDVEEERAAVQAFARELGLSFPLALDEAGEVSAHSYNVRTMPTSLIIDRNGVIRDSWGGQIAKSAMLARLGKVW